MAEKVQFIFGKSNAPRTVTVDCSIQVPMEDGSFQTQQIKTNCLLISDDEFDAFYAVGGGKDVALVEYIVKGFPGFEDETGKSVDFATAKKALFGLPNVRRGIVQSYALHRAGVVEKN